MNAVALASVITSAVVGVSGAGVLVWATRKNAERADAARVEQHKADAYIEILELVEREGRWQHQRAANLMARSEQDRPTGYSVEKPAESDRIRTAALLGAFGSKPLREKHDNWSYVVAGLDREYDHLEFARLQDYGGAPGAPVEASALTNLLSRLPLEERERESLRSAIAAELGHRLLPVDVHTGGLDGGRRT